MNPNRNRRRGKNTERQIAKRIGGKRMGILGKDDVQTGAFSVEVKDRKVFAGTKFMEQAVRNCPTDKTPLVIIHVTHKPHNEDLVIMRLKDFQDWYGEFK